MKVPVTVVIPTIESRRDFLNRRCIPSVEACEPDEIIIVGGPEGANEKRNWGASRATSAYLLFVDDDSTLNQNCIEKMLGALLRNPAATFAYSDFCRNADPKLSFPYETGLIRSGSFDERRLRKCNYIHTTSLIRKDRFPGFDNSICRFQDWDLWLSISKAGGWGVYIPEVLFELWQIDKGISQSVPTDSAMSVIVRKHGL